MHEEIEKAKKIDNEFWNSQSNLGKAIRGKK